MSEDTNKRNIPAAIKAPPAAPPAEVVAPGVSVASSEPSEYQALGLETERYQSDIAQKTIAERQRQRAALKNSVEPAKIEDGGSTTATPVVVVNREDEERLVRVVPKISAMPKIGHERYQFTAGKPCLVPNRIARLMEEKGHI